MKFRLTIGFVLLALFLCIGSIAAEAACTVVCNVEYAVNYGWSEKFKREIDFYTGQELNEATNSYSYEYFVTYALIWFDQDQVAIVKLSRNAIGGADELSVESLLISPVEGVDKSGRTWRFSTPLY
ncbi:hypothetical protein [Desulfovibrio sp. Huiquan2017]|uniref:hypothetical protein n=1 Tax=Desulfovibrio sp. Huiquan2017 TaxID=2816861 RepID=UPI001A919808|nr:hypothetical protein [Desulfovibrio sp. Huiquan2017]